MNTWKLTIENLRRKNFTPDEFLRSNTADASLKDDDPNNDIDNTPNYAQLTCGIKLADKMQELRAAINLPFDVTSGFRCEKLNKRVGGAPNSKHMQFLACDFNIRGMKPHEGVAAIKKSGVSIDRCFVERGCIHVQVKMRDEENDNFFGSAYLDEEGNWQVISEIKKI